MKIRTILCVDGSCRNFTAQYSTKRLTAVKMPPYLLKLKAKSTTGDVLLLSSLIGPITSANSSSLLNAVVNTIFISFLLRLFTYLCCLCAILLHILQRYKEREIGLL